MRRKWNSPSPWHYPWPIDHMSKMNFLRPLNQWSFRFGLDSKCYQARTLRSLKWQKKKKEFARNYMDLKYNLTYLTSIVNFMLYYDIYLISSRECRLCWIDLFIIILCLDLWIVCYMYNYKKNYYYYIPQWLQLRA